MSCEPVIVQPTTVEGPLVGKVIAVPGPQAVVSVTAAENSYPTASIKVLDGVMGSILVLTPGH